MWLFSVFFVFNVKMFFVLILCPVLVIDCVQTLTIDTQLGTSVEDCFERISIGEQLPSAAIYRNVSELTIRECEQICKQDKQCQAYDYGVGAKGNATCNLSTADEKEIKEKNILSRHPDYDVYVRRFQCEQSPPTPLQPLQDEPSGSHRPIFRPDMEERPLSDYVVSSDINPYRPDDLSNPGPDFNSPPSYGDHRPQEIPYKPEPYRPNDPNRPRPDLYRPGSDSYKPKPPNDPYKPDRPYRPNDKFRPEKPHDVYRPSKPRPVASDELNFQGYNKPQMSERPEPQRPEKPSYQYIVRPNRRPHFEDYPRPPNSYQDNLPGPVGPPDRPYRPNRPYDYNHQYANNYGQNDNSVYVEIYDPPRPYIPIKDRPNHPQYKPGFLGYGTYFDQNSYSNSYIGSITETGYNQNQDRPIGPPQVGYGQNHDNGGYGLQRPGNRPDQGIKGSSYGSQNHNGGGYGSTGPSYSSNSQSYGSSGQNYESHGQHYGGSGQSYGGNGQSYGSSGQSYGGSEQSYGGGGQSYGGSGQSYGDSGQSYGTSNHGYGGNQNYGSDHGYGGQDYGSSYNKPDRNKYGEKGSYNSQSNYENGYNKPENQGYGQKPIKPNQDKDHYGSNSYSNSQSSYESYGNHRPSYSAGSYGQSYGSSNSYGGSYNNYETNGYGNRPAYYDFKKPHINERPDPEYPSTGYDNQPTGYGNQKPSNQYPKPGYSEKPNDQPDNEKPGNQKPVYDYEKHVERPAYGDSKPTYDPDRPNVKPVYEYELDKPSNVPAYIAKPDGGVVTSRPVVIGDYGERHSYREPGIASYKACFRRVLAGKRALRSFVRKVINCETLEDCRRECATEKRFHCESFNYRIATSLRRKGLCELMTQPIESFDIRRDFVEDKNYDFYEIDRNSLEPNCPETLGGPGMLHSGFLSSKPNRVDEWHNMNWNRNSGDRFPDRRNGHGKYGEQPYIPYQIGQLKSDENWGQYGGFYGGNQYYKDRNDYHKSVNHWGLTSEIPPYGVKPFTEYDFKHFNYDNLKKHFEFTPKLDDFTTKRGNSYHTLGYTAGTNMFGVTDDHPTVKEYTVKYHTTGKEFPTGTEYHSTGKDYHTTGRNDYHTTGRGDYHTTGGGDYHSTGRGDYHTTGRSDYHTPERSDYHTPERSDFHTTGRNDYHTTSDHLSRGDYHTTRKIDFDYDHRKGDTDGTWKRKWNDSGEVAFEVEDRSFLEPIDKNEVGLESECVSQRRPGMTITSGTIRRALRALNVVDCEAKCFAEEEFKCVSYSFRYTSSVGSDNCFLSERPYRGLEMSADSNSDVYAMPQESECAHLNNHWVESECFWHVRSDSSVIGTAVKAQLTVAGLGACEAECIRAQGFFCRGFSFRFEPAPPVDSDYNCVLTSSPPTTLSKENIRTSPGHELYARGNFGRGCEPATYDDVKEVDECYLQYDKSARLRGAALRGQARAADERACAAACTHAPFLCLTFSYRKNEASDVDNCFLSDVRLFDLKRGVDFVHSPDHLLFSFDLFNSKCWKEIHKDKPVPELPRPILKPSEEVHHPSSPAGITEKEVHIDTTVFTEPTEFNIPPRPVEPGHKPFHPFDSNEDHQSGPDFRPNKHESHYPKEKPFSNYGPSSENYRPDPIDSRPQPPTYDRPNYRPQVDYWPGNGLKETGLGPGPSNARPAYGSGPPMSRWPHDKNKPIGPWNNERETNNIAESTWRHYTVSGFPCRAGTTCAQNHITGHWACEPEGGEIGSWDYCCAPSHRCGYSEGFHKPWCYVGQKEDQWRPCSDKYFPYHQHKVPHPSLGDRVPPRNRPWRETSSTPAYIPNWDKPPGKYLPEADRKYWDDLYENGPKAYYDRSGNPLPGYSRVPNNQNKPYQNTNERKYQNGQWVSISQEFGPVASQLGAPRYWPVAYLHKSPPPNMTYFRYNENNNHTELDKTTIKPKLIPESRNFDIPLNLNENTTETVTNNNEPNDTEHKEHNVTKTNNIKNVTTEKPKELNTKQTDKENYTDFDTIKGIDDKLDHLTDLTDSIEVLDLEDIKGDKSELKTLEAEERQIEAIGRLVASRRGTSLVIEKREQKEMEAKNIAIDDTFNFGNKFPTDRSERRGMIRKLSKEEIERERNRDRSLEVSETVFVRPPRILNNTKKAEETTENVRKTIINGKVFYDATIRENNLNSTRKAKSLRRLEFTPLNRKKSVRTRNTNPVRRVKRVYKKRYNPDEVRRRLLDRDNRTMRVDTENSRVIV